MAGAIPLFSPAKENARQTAMQTNVSWPLGYNLGMNVIYAHDVTHANQRAGSNMESNQIACSTNRATGAVLRVQQRDCVREKD